MKTLWIIDNYATEPQYNGITRQFDFASALDREGVRTAVISSTYSHFNKSYFLNKRYNSNKIGNQSKFIYLKVRPAYGESLPKRLLSMFDFVRVILLNLKKMELECGKPDVVVGASIHPLAWIAAYIVSKRYRAKFVAEVRDFWPDYFLKTGIMSKYNPVVMFFGLIERWAFKHANSIITSLPYADRYISRKLGFPKEKIIYLGQPMDCDRFDFNVKENLNMIPNEILCFMDKSFVCLYTGYYMKYEGIYVMLEAAKILLEKELPIKFVFAGSGREEEGMRKFATTNKLNNVFISKRLKKEAIPPLLNHAQVYLCEQITPNEAEFEFGLSKNKLSEYLYADGCVIFGFSYKKNIVSESKGGEVIKPNNPQELANAIEKYYRLDIEERKAIGCNGKQYIKNNYSVEQLTKKYKRIVEEENDESTIVE